MKKKFALLVTGCLLLTSCGTITGTQNLTSSAGKAVACYAEAVSLEPLHQFSYDFFQWNMDSENPIMSPLSAYYAMALAASGADGETREEMENVLGENYYQICDEMMEVLQRHGSDSYDLPITVTLANSAWIDDDFKADKDWLLEVNTYFESEVFKTDLSSEEAMSDINQWCSEKTNGLIPQFISNPLPDSTRLALFNALYFNSQWRDQFGKGATSEEVFYPEDGALAAVDMMKNYGDYQLYFETAQLQGVCLPYYDGTTFVAMMSTDDTPIRDLYNSLTMEELVEFAKTDNTTLINLQLPKFEADCTMELIEYFKGQGITTAFDAECADFQKIGECTSGNPIYISDIIQQAVIKVNEDGTEAGAVTMVAATEGCALIEDQPIDVFFNKPFFYMIYDKKADTPLFMGIYERP